MQEPLEPLSIAFALADESPTLVKLLVIGVRTNGSVLMLDTGLDGDEVQKMCSDFRAWRGELLARELTGVEDTAD